MSVAHTRQPKLNQSCAQQSSTPAAPAGAMPSASWSMPLCAAPGPIRSSPFDSVRLNQATTSQRGRGPSPGPSNLVAAT